MINKMILLAEVEVPQFDKLKNFLWAWGFVILGFMAFLAACFLIFSIVKMAIKLKLADDSGEQTKIRQTIAWYIVGLLVSSLCTITFWILSANFFGR